MEGETPLHSTITTTVAAGATKTTNPAAGAQRWKQQTSDPGVSQGTLIGPPAHEPFCHLRAPGSVWPYQAL